MLQHKLFVIWTLKKVIWSVLKTNFPRYFKNGNKFQNTYCTASIWNQNTFYFKWRKRSWSLKNWPRGYIIIHSWLVGFRPHFQECSVNEDQGQSHSIFENRTENALVARNEIVLVISYFWTSISIYILCTRIKKKNAIH